MKPFFFVYIVFFLVLTGCLSEKKIVRRYYTIEIPASQKPENNDSILPVKGICKVDEVEINQVYEKNQIVNRGGSNEISYYMYNQWAIRPADAIQELIREYLESAGIFQTISARYTGSLPDYRFWTSVSRLELDESNKSFSAHMQLEFRIINNSTDQVIISHMADRVSKLKQKDLDLFAFEVSTIICEELKIFSGMIRDNSDLFARDP